MVRASEKPKMMKPKMLTKLNPKDSPRSKKEPANIHILRAAENITPLILNQQSKLLANCWQLVIHY